MAFNFSSTAGTSGITTITVSATSTDAMSYLISNYTLSNENGNSMLMAIAQKAYEPAGTYIEFSPSAMTWDSSGGTGSLRINSNDNWVIASDEWILLSTISDSRDGKNTLSGNGNTIIGIRGAENSGSSRSGSISGYCVSDSSITASTTVSQSGNYVAPYIYIKKEHMSVASGETVVVSVSANTTWNTLTDERWIELQTQSGSGNGSITFVVAPNSSDFDRSAEITVYNYADDVYATMKVLQPKEEGKPYIIVDPQSFTVAASGETNTISVSANCDYEITADVRWITVGAASGSGDGSVSFTTQANSGASDVGNIDFVNSALSRTVSVQRRGVGRYLSADTSSVSMHMSGGVAEVLVYSNVEWVAEAVVDSELATKWISVAPSSGSGNGSVRITVSSGITARSATVVLYNTTYGLSFVITVNQTVNGKYIYYTTIDDSVLELRSSNMFGDAVLVSNTNVNGNGILEFDRDVVEITGPFAECSDSGYLNTKDKLTSITLPETLQSIGDQSFYYLRYLTGLTIPNSVVSIGKRIIFGSGSYNNRFSVVYSSGMTSVPASSMSNSYLVSFDLNGAQITSIGDHALVGCKLTSFVVPDGVETIGEGSFYSATTLASIELPPTLQSIGRQAFAYNNSLQSIMTKAKTAPTIVAINSTISTFYGVSTYGSCRYPIGSDYSVWQASSPNQLSQWTFIPQ